MVQDQARHGQPASTESKAPLESQEPLCPLSAESALVQRVGVQDLQGFGCFGALEVRNMYNFSLVLDILSFPSLRRTRLPFSVPGLSAPSSRMRSGARASVPVPELLPHGPAKNLDNQLHKNLMPCSPCWPRPLRSLEWANPEDQEGFADIGFQNATVQDTGN